MTDKEVYQNVKAKEKFKKYFSAGHAVDTYRIAITHTNESSEVSSQGSQFGGRGRKRFEHGGSDSPAKRRNNFKSLLDFWRGDQSDVVSENPENPTLRSVAPDCNIRKVDNCLDGTISLLDNGFGNRGK